MISAIKFLNITGLKHTTTETFTHLLMRQLTLNFQNDSEATGGMMTSSSPVASRNLANRTAWLENGLERKMTATSGRRCSERFEKFNHVGSWAKTFSALLIGRTDWYSTKCRLTWKLKGTKYNRLYFQLYPSTHRTEETECGLLPTPKTMDMAEGINSGKTLEFKNGVYTNVRDKDGMRFGPSLNDLMKNGLLPTPMASDGTTGAIIGENDKFHMTKNGVPRKVNQNGVDGSVGLGRFAVMGMLPTPMASDCGEKVTGLETQDSFVKMTRQVTGKPSQLSPRFVMEMMGFPTDWTELPFLNGDKNQSRPEEMQ